MLIKKPSLITRDPIWSKIASLSLVLFFVLLGDAILSFWVPNLLQNSLKNVTAMGFIISFSSVVGLGTDIVLPQLLKRITVKKLITFGAISIIVFAIVLIQGRHFSSLALFLFAMAIWGFYNEFLGFAQQQFIADSVPLKSRSGAWGILRVFKGLAYFLGPMIAGWLLMKGEILPAIFAIIFVAIGFAVLFLSKKTHERPVEIDVKEVNFVKELEHWGVLFKYVWPILVLSISLGLIDSYFWTIGAVWTEILVKKSIWGSMFLPLYTLPALFMGFILTRFNIYKGKKKLAIKFFFLSGLFLITLGFFDYVFWQLAIVFLSSLMLAVVYPLTDGVYSDIVARMGRERKHMIGLSNSTSSIAYIIGPIMAGLSASFFGEIQSFQFLGILVMIISIVLYISTPKKLKVPQKEINTWENK